MSRTVYGYDPGWDLPVRQRQLRVVAVILAAVGAGFVIGWRSSR